MSRVKQPLLLELLLQLLKGHIQVPYPVRRQLGAVQLICTVPGKHADPAEYHGLHAVSGRNRSFTALDLNMTHRRALCPSFRVK